MKNYLSVIRPITVTSSMLTACDVPETDYAAWSSGTTYAEGARVIKSSKIWESAAGTNTNHDPEEEGTTWWVFVSYDNRWKSLDTSNSTQTIRAGSMSYTIAPGKVVSAVALLNVGANSVRVRMVDSIEGTVYDSTKKLRGVIPESNWWGWFFSEVYPEDEIIFDDLPSYGTASIVIDIDAGGGTASVGVIAIGVKQSLNFLVTYGVEFGMLDFSRKTRDDFGEVQFVLGNYADTVELPCVVENAKIKMARKILRDYRASPCLWIVDNLPSIYGWFNDFTIQVSYPGYSDVSIKIEGLI